MSALNWTNSNKAVGDSITVKGVLVRRILEPRDRILILESGHCYRLGP